MYRCVRVRQTPKCRTIMRNSFAPSSSRSDLRIVPNLDFYFFSLVFPPTERMLVVDMVVLLLLLLLVFSFVFVVFFFFLVCVLYSSCAQFRIIRPRFVCMKFSVCVIFSLLFARSKWQMREICLQFRYSYTPTKYSTAHSAVLSYFTRFFLFYSILCCVLDCRCCWCYGFPRMLLVGFFLLNFFCLFNS